MSVRAQVKPRVWDCFPFAGELDMLELRLGHLDGDVYRHVITEATVTYAGMPKPLAFADNRARFSAWLDKIVYLPLDPDELPSGIDLPCSAPEPARGLCEKAWGREQVQRDAAWRGLTGCEAGDLVLCGDADEIPDTSVLAALRKEPTAAPVALEMRHHLFAADWEHPKPDLCTVAVRRGMLRGFSELRRRPKIAVLPGAGHHFSWLGGPAAIDAKNAAHAHQELAWKIGDANRAGRLYEQGWCPWDDTQLSAAEVDASYPEAIRKRQCPEIWFRPRD
jgi:hypothetical protein